MMYKDFFYKATHTSPFPFQERFAGAAKEDGEGLYSLVNVPTGLGKTAMVIIGWLWRRFNADASIRSTTPRRLVYCLPMRVLVEQTRDSAVLWLHNLGLLGGKVTVHVLMGGEDKDDWDIHPERDAILIGTQDMLLSRALNRGYAASRARWPIQFGLLHTDCLWVFDEIQLMGAGLATTAQMEAFRHMLGSRDGHGCRSVWMSATMRPDWLKTVDFKDRVDGLPSLELSGEDHKNDDIDKRWNALKPLERVVAPIASGDAAGLATKILKEHKPGTRTIVVVNTVRRACELFEALTRPADASTTKSGGKKAKKADPNDSPATSLADRPRFVLLHSRFRPGDREAQVKAALADAQGSGAIVVSTQVIEAGVDVSATTLFTDLAPWASLVQRFGRCNRRGTENDSARVFWIDLPATEAQAAKMAPPYELEQLRMAREFLETCKNGVGPAALKQIQEEHADQFSNVMRFEHGHVIRRKDLIDLFDTTPDLAGNDIDIDRFVRELEHSDVRLFWRDWPQPKTGPMTPPDDDEAPRREELCAAPIGSERNPAFREFARKHDGKIRRWNFLDKKWEKANPAEIAPGQVFLVHSDAGGYSPERGWDATSRDPVEPVAVPAQERDGPPDSNDDDAPSRLGVWKTIAEHADEVCAEIDAVVKALPFADGMTNALRGAARWHDRGKAHAVFQDAVDDGQVVDKKGKQVKRPERPESWHGCRFVAKAPDKRRNRKGELVDPGFWCRYGRKRFRHELASALAVLDPRNKSMPDESRDLIAYLVAAHHGKVRLSIRSFPDECRPEPRADGGRERRFARGVWDGDELPETDLGGGITAPAVTLSLEPMELGLCEREPFAGQPSWAERMLHLRDSLGPFRLAFLEALLRAADMRASKKEAHP